MKAGAGGIVHVHYDVRGEIYATAKWLGLYPSGLMAAALVFAWSTPANRRKIRMHVQMFQKYKRGRRRGGLDTRISREAKVVMDAVMRRMRVKAVHGYRPMIVRAAWTIWKGTFPQLCKLPGWDAKGNEEDPDAV